MTKKKYEFVWEDQIKAQDGKTILTRIRALKDIPIHGIKAGELGGYIESEANLAQDGFAWVGGQAHVYESGQVIDHALANEYSRIYGSARLEGFAIAKGLSSIRDAALVQDCAEISGASVTCGRAVIKGRASITDLVQVKDTASVGGLANLFNSVVISGNARIGDHVWMLGNVHVSENARVNGHVIAMDFAKIKGEANLGGNHVIFGNALIDTAPSPQPYLIAA